MNSLSRILLAVWLLLGWTPHGVCSLQAGVKRLLVSRPVSKGCPLCQKLVDESSGPAMPKQANPTSSEGPGRNAPDSSPAKCCHPDAAVTVGKVSPDGADKPVFRGVPAIASPLPIFVGWSNFEVLSDARSGLRYEPVPLHLRLCVLRI
ncbi:hypothetical protein [Thermopirellula anaerolimosa]